jgi:hypothetical protein
MAPRNNSDNNSIKGVSWKRQLTEIIHDRATASGGFVDADESMHSMQMSDSLFFSESNFGRGDGSGDSFMTGGLGSFLK